MRLWRILIVFLIFASSSLYRLNQHKFLLKSLQSFVDIPSDNNNDEQSIHNYTHTVNMIPIVQREWDRMLFGVFTYDSPNEAEIRLAARETHLDYFKHYYNTKTTNTLEVSDIGTVGPDTICSLKEIMNNSTLAKDATSCRIIYTFVMGGGIGDEYMKRKVDKLDKGRYSNTNVKTRCLWEDPECGGRDITKWTLVAPKCNISSTLANEMKEYNDITFLSIPENHELGEFESMSTIFLLAFWLIIPTDKHCYLGKTDTWFTYVAMLTRQHPELQIGFVGKIDSDNFIRWPRYLKFLDGERYYINLHPYIYAGYAIHKNVCKGRMYGFACANPDFIAACFASGAMAYLSTPLAQHVFMDGTTLERKKQVWIVGEDMQLANMAFSNPKIIPYVMNHRYRNGRDISGLHGYDFSYHCSNDPIRYRKEYYEIYPEQQKKEGEVNETVVSTNVNTTA